MTVYDLQQLIGAVIPVIVPLAGAIYTWYATQKAAARKEIDALSGRLSRAEGRLSTMGDVNTELTDHEKRLLKIEGELTHLPAREDVSDLKLAISELSGTVGRLEEQLKGSVGRLDEQVGSIGRTVHRIDDYLREAGKGL